MSIAETYEIYYVVLATMDQIFQFWLSASFAVILTSYFASEMLTRWIFWLVSASYVLFSVLLGTRYFLAGAKLVELRDRLMAAGEHFDPTLVSSIALYTLLLYIIGVIGTLSYLRYSYRRHLT